MSYLKKIEAITKMNHGQEYKYFVTRSAGGPIVEGFEYYSDANCYIAEHQGSKIYNLKTVDAEKLAAFMESIELTAASDQELDKSNLKDIENANKKAKNALKILESLVVPKLESDHASDGDLLYLASVKRLRKEIKDTEKFITKEKKK